MREGEFFPSFWLQQSSFWQHPVAYSANEGLHLSEKEREIIVSIFENIQRELNNTIDDFSQDVMISQIEVLLNYSNRFYKRQFITRKAANNDLLAKMEELLNAYFDKEETINNGLPTVEHLAEQLNVSPLKVTLSATKRKQG